MSDVTQAQLLDDYDEPRNLGRTFWQLVAPPNPQVPKDMEDYDEGFDQRWQVDDPNKAFLISSKCENGKHAPVIDLDYPIERTADGLVLKGGFTARELKAIDTRGKKCGLFELSLDGDVFPITVREVTLKFKVPFRLIPSSTADHYHLYIDSHVEEADYMHLLSALADAEVVEKGYYNASLERMMTFVRFPGRVKAEDEKIWQMTYDATTQSIRYDDIGF